MNSLLGNEASQPTLSMSKDKAGWEEERRRPLFRKVASKFLSMDYDEGPLAAHFYKSETKFLPDVHAGMDILLRATDNVRSSYSIKIVEIFMEEEGQGSGVNLLRKQGMNIADFAPTRRLTFVKVR